MYRVVHKYRLADRSEIVEQHRGCKDMLDNLHNDGHNDDRNNHSLSESLDNKLTQIHELAKFSENIIQAKIC